MIGILNRERAIREAEDARTRARGYTGKLRWMVIHELKGAVTVHAPERTSAVYTAARYWGMDPRKPEFHQNVRVKKVR